MGRKATLSGKKMDAGYTLKTPAMIRIELATGSQYTWSGVRNHLVVGPLKYWSEDPNNTSSCPLKRTRAKGQPKGLLLQAARKLCRGHIEAEIMYVGIV